MDISLVFHSILLIAILILIGTVVSRTFPFTNDTRQMFISLITNIGMPSIILSSIFNVTFSNDMFKTLGVIFLISICINIVGLVLGGLVLYLFNKTSTRKIEFIILSAFGNTGFIGIPLCAMLFGAEGALYAAIFDAGVDFTIWTVGIVLIQGKKTINKRILKNIINIPLIAIFVGLSVGLLKLSVPTLIIETTNTLAAFAIPLAMFFIGANLRQLQRSHIKASFPDISIPILNKLVILPVVVITFLLNTNLDDTLKSIIIIQSMMPALTLSPVLFAKYARDYEYGALTTILSTFLSLFIIPLLVYLIT